MEKVPAILEEQDDVDKVERKLNELREALDRDDDDSVLSCLAREFPRIMAVIPRPRRQRFVEGVWEYYREHGIEV